MLSPYAKREVLIIGGVGALLVAGCLAMAWWVVATVLAGLTAALLAFFRDPSRPIPTMRGHMLSPADGRISSIHDLKHFEPFDGPAKCIRIFLSVLNVHVNRCPCHGRVASVTRQPGQYLNALNPEAAEVNESVTVVLHDPGHDRPVAAVRQIAGTIARRIVCGLVDGDVVQRGQRYGIIKFGSTAELYLPDPANVKVQVRQGQRVHGAATVLAVTGPNPAQPRPTTEHTQVSSV